MTKRSLMLAGGGLKIAFQAGVLQVWLDEAKIKFDHADAVSAACFNLAMWTQGMSGKQIADNWRSFKPLSALSIRVSRLFLPGALFSLNAFRRRIFPAWGIDFTAIRSSERDATFNIYNFSQHELMAVRPSELTEDHLIATGSLSGWFPPVTIAGDTLIDAVFNTATNLEAAIAHGADELWVIWTTSRKGRWHDSVIGAFFGIFEATGNHTYRSVLARIDKNNAAICRGETGEFGRPLRVRELAAEVPIHYLLTFRKAPYEKAVEQGMAAARAWCTANEIPLAAVET
jgi:Patatin-like phospholipase